MNLKFLTKEVCKDILITAVEGGINYWSEVVKYNPSNGTCTIKVIDEDGEDSGKTFNITTSTIRQGYERALSDKITFDEADCLDSIEADLVVQYGIFNEVIYG